MTREGSLPIYRNPNKHSIHRTSDRRYVGWLFVERHRRFLKDLYPDWKFFTYISNTGDWPARVSLSRLDSEGNLQVWDVPLIEDHVDEFIERMIKENNG